MENNFGLICSLSFHALALSAVLLLFFLTCFASVSIFITLMTFDRQFPRGSPRQNTSWCSIDRSPQSAGPLSRTARGRRGWDQAEALEQVQEKRPEGEEINLRIQTFLELGWVPFPADGRTEYNNKLNQ